MNKPHTTHFFIISYDSISKKWSSDYDKEEELFIDGTICTHEIDEEVFADGTVHKYEGSKKWSGGYLGDGEYHPLEEMLMDKISDAIDHLNTPTNET